MGQSTSRGSAEAFVYQSDHSSNSPYFLTGVPSKPLMLSGVPWWSRDPANHHCSLHILCLTVLPSQ